MSRALKQDRSWILIDRMVIQDAVNCELWDGHLKSLVDLLKDAVSLLWMAPQQLLQQDSSGLRCICHLAATVMLQTDRHQQAVHQLCQSGISISDVGWDLALVDQVLASGPAPTWVSIASEPAALR